MLIRPILWTVGSAVLCTCILGGNTCNAQAFSDDFNRPDSSVVGNGWSNTAGNYDGNLSIQNDQLISDGQIGTAGIYRPYSFVAPVTISASLFGTDDSLVSGDRYSDTLTLDNNGNIDSGYGISVGRTGSDWNNSSVSLMDGTDLITTLPSTFQFGPQVNVTATFSPDGSINGNVNDGSNIFNFSFGPRTILSTGTNTSIVLGPRDWRNPDWPPTYPRLDNFVIAPAVVTESVNRMPATTLTTVYTPPPEQVVTLQNNTVQVNNTDPNEQGLLVYSNGQFSTTGTINRSDPTIVLTHGFTSNPSMWNQFAQQYPSGVNIVAWNWSEDASLLSGLGFATSRTDLEGTKLGKSLVTALGAGYNGDIHEWHFLKA